MGIMYAYKCDLCGEVQVKDLPHQIEGKTYTEDGVTKFSCRTCQGKLKAALALGKGGLDDPLKHVAGLLEKKEEEFRARETAAEMKSGGFLGVADEIMRKKQPINVAGLDFESQYRANRALPTSGHPSLPALPAPKPDEPKNKKKKDKKG